MKVKREDEHAERMRRTLILSLTLVLLPVLAAIAFVAVYRALTVPPPPRQDEATVALTNRLAHVEMLSLHELQMLRREARQAGYDTEAVDVRIWAESVAHPPVLISVPPPSMDDTWAWTLSADGAYAIATGSKTDSIDRRMVGLYDLKTDAWVWTNKFVWPTQYGEPHVINRALVLRYAKNNAAFAMEVSADGKIVSIDPLSNRAIEPLSPPPARPECPGQPVALKHNVFFVTDPTSWHLTGYAHCRLPGLYPAGKSDGRMCFSGNGLLKFQTGDGKVIIEDSLTQHVLQRFNVWTPSTNTLFRKATTTLDGDTLTLSVETLAPARKLDIAIDVIAEKAKTSLNTETSPPHSLSDKELWDDGRWGSKTSKGPPPHAITHDGRWVFFAQWKDRKQYLVIAANGEPAVREIARVPFDNVLGSVGYKQYVVWMNALEGGNHLVISCRDEYGVTSDWLLHLPVVWNYASQLERMTAADLALANPEKDEKEKDKKEADDDDDYFGTWMSYYKPAPPIAPIALHAEQLYQHQAWFYAAARFATCMEYAATDPRAPRINPLLFARTAFLAQQPKLGKAICRSAILALESDRTAYNRMVRYHLQALYFSDGK